MHFDIRFQNWNTRVQVSAHEQCMKQICAECSTTGTLSQLSGITALFLWQNNNGHSKHPEAQDLRPIYKKSQCHILAGNTCHECLQHNKQKDGKFAKHISSRYDSLWLKKQSKHKNLFWSLFDIFVKLQI